MNRKIHNAGWHILLRRLYATCRRELLLVCMVVIFAGCCKESELPNANRGLYSQDHREKTQALQVFAQCGERSQGAVQRIAALMYDKNVGVASAAAYALRKINTKEAQEALKNAEAARERKRQKS